MSDDSFLRKKKSRNAETRQKKERMWVTIEYTLDDNILSSACFVCVCVCVCGRSESKVHEK